MVAASNGNRMLTPKLFAAPAPSIPASMIPGPAPVMTIQSTSASSRASATVCSYNGSSRFVRAEPKIAALRAERYGSNTVKP